jgi:hypothetical protein
LPLVLDQGGCRIYQTSPEGFLGVYRCSEQRPSNSGGVHRRCGWLVRTAQGQGHRL